MKLGQECGTHGYEPRNTLQITLPMVALTYLHICRMIYSGDQQENRSRTRTPMEAPSSSLCRLQKHQQYNMVTPPPTDSEVSFCLSPGA